ncbi:hypothetical protein G7062_03135 [Erysipelothrix sp. HDW6C]|uniref:CdaR family protein n=1 Tax=Erysipelothrix sp. HDW6C TaxID=2714930 RepID=UPI001408D463|nr:CdaR family protein [Erysipelothrix sp. HDW6C]QIK69348.1 hypothetical protein G7062_03135 [Erysipelothrix sp. HDW6C]
MSNKNDKKDNKEKDIDVAEEKVELAQFIADKSQKITKRTEALANGGLRIVRWLSDWFDRILFNPRHGKLVAFGVALLVYIAFNQTSVATPMESSKDKNGIPVSVVYNSEMYEISGVDETVDVTFIGNQGDISIMSLDNSDIKVELDLSGLTEGTQQVKYKVVGASNRVRTIIEPASANVTIRTKDAQKVSLGYDFINLEKLGSQYVLGTPELSSREISIKASRETLDQVAFVKALIDVQGQTKDFEVEAQIVAYNQQGEKLDQVDIIPKTVTAKVGISSPSKNVPIRLLFDGDFPEGKIISDFKLDTETIMIYAPQSVLDSIDEITVPIATSLLTGDTTKLQQTISLPTGVRTGSVTKVNIEVKLGEATSKVFEGVPVLFENNVNGLKATVKNKGDATTTLTVYGTKENLEGPNAKFKIDDVVAYIDLRDAVAGENQKAKLFVKSRSSNAVLFKIVSDKTEIIVDILK